MIRARFTWSRIGRIIVLEDRNTGGKSLSNDIELVIKDLRDWGIDVDMHRIIYRDTHGYWEAILTRHGGFDGYMSLGGVCARDDAIRAAASRKTWG